MILKYFLIFWVLPGCTGILTIRDKQNNWLYYYIAGILLTLATFQAVVLPCIFLRESLDFLIRIWIFLYFVVLLYLIIKNRKRILNFRLDFNLNRKINKTDVRIIIVFALIFFQTFMLSRYAHYDADDAMFVGAATTAWDTNRLFLYDNFTGDLVAQFYPRYVFSPFPLYIASIAQMIGCHPSILAHTLLPTVFIPMAYMVYFLIGKVLFDNNELKNELFLVLISIMGIFSFWSGYYQQAFLLLRIWQGKAILAGVLLPMLFYMALKYWIEGYRCYDWVVLFCVMVSTTLVSSMGIILGAIALGILGIMVLLMRRDPKSVFRLFLCTIPNIMLAVCYLVI